MNTKNSISYEIIKYLEEKNGYIFGGVIESEIHNRTGAKYSNVSRRCRELADEGKIEKRLENVAGTRNKVVQYKII